MPQVWRIPRIALRPWTVLHPVTMKPLTKFATALASLTAAAACAAEPGIQAVVRADQPGHRIPETLYGIFFEDINYIIY